MVGGAGMCVTERCKGGMCVAETCKGGMWVTVACDVSRVVQRCGCGVVQRCAVTAAVMIDEVPLQPCNLE